MTKGTFSHQPLGPRGTPIRTDRITLAWCDHHGIPRLRLYDEMIDLAKDDRGRRWNASSRTLVLDGGSLRRIAVGDTGEGTMHLQFEGDDATLDMPLARDVWTRRGRVQIRATLPETCIDAMPGRLLTDIVALPFVFDGIVSDVERHGGTLDVALVDPFVLLPLEGILEEQPQGRKAHGRRHADLRSVRRTRP